MVTLPASVAFASDTSVRIVMHSCLVETGTSNASSFTSTYAKLPPSSSPWLQQPAGVLARNFYDPNYYPSVSTTNGYIPEGIDPTTINGVAWASPYTGAGVGKPLSVIIGGITYVYIVGGGTITAGDFLFAGDQYGRVDNAANLGIAGGTLAYALGRAQQNAAATANLIISVEVAPVPVRL